MRRAILAGLILVLGWWLAAVGAEPWLEGLNQISAENLRINLTFLASEALEGRGSGQRGAEAAAEFIAAELSKLGLKPLGRRGSFLQEVPIVEYRLDAAQTEIKLEEREPAEIVRGFKYGRDFFGGYHRDLYIAAPVAFAGYGITAPEYNYDDYQSIDARGKIVLVFDHEPQEDDSSSPFDGLASTLHAASRLKALNAQRHGAVALLVAGEPNRKHPSNVERLARIPGIMERMLKHPSQALASSEIKIPVLNINDQMLEAILSAANQNPSELQRRIDESLKPASFPIAGLRASIRITVAEARNLQGHNVVGMIEGSNERLKNEYVLLGAHYDHDGVRDGKVYPGADDDGSGTVAVMEMARAFATSKNRPPRSLAFALFAAEEKGLLGSFHFADNPPMPLSALKAVLNFDMVGRNERPDPQTEDIVEIPPDTSNLLNVIGTSRSPRLRRLVEEANKQVGLALDYKYDKDSALNLFQRSDHFPFALRQVPVVFFFTGFHPDYHQPSDTVDKINFAKLERVTRLGYIMAWRIASDGIDR